MKADEGEVACDTASECGYSHDMPKKMSRMEVIAKATKVFGSQAAAERWIEEPAIGLNQMCPIDLLSTRAGTQLVDTYLDQIEYSVYV